MDKNDMEVKKDMKMRAFMQDEEVVEVMESVEAQDRRIVLETALLYFAKHIENNIEIADKELKIIPDESLERCEVKKKGMSVALETFNEDIAKLVEYAKSIDVGIAQLCEKALIYYIDLLKQDETVIDYRLTGVMRNINML